MWRELDQKNAAERRVGILGFGELGRDAAKKLKVLGFNVVATQEEFLKGLTESGWAIERPFQRMRFGRATTQGAELPFAVAGPEFG